MGATHRTVIGIELRSSLSRSTCWTCLRRPTKWLLSISAASRERRGAQRLSEGGQIGSLGLDAPSTYDLQNATYRFIFSMSISPTTSVSLCRFMWIFMTCLAMVCLRERE